MDKKFSLLIVILFSLQHKMVLPISISTFSQNYNREQVLVATAVLLGTSFGSGLLGYYHGTKKKEREHCNQINQARITHENIHDKYQSAIALKDDVLDGKNFEYIKQYKATLLRDIEQLQTAAVTIQASLEKQKVKYLIATLEDYKKEIFSKEGQAFTNHVQKKYETLLSKDINATILQKTALRAHGDMAYPLMVYKQELKEDLKQSVLLFSQSSYDQDHQKLQEIISKLETLNADFNFHLSSALNKERKQQEEEKRKEQLFNAELANYKSVKQCITTIEQKTEMVLRETERKINSFLRAKEGEDWAIQHTIKKLVSELHDDQKKLHNITIGLEKHSSNAQIVEAVRQQITAYQKDIEKKIETLAIKIEQLSNKIASHVKPPAYNPELTNSPYQPPVNPECFGNPSAPPM